MSEKEIYITIRFIDEEDACETTMYGEINMLSSLVYSSMVANPKFAEIILNAATCFVSKSSRQAILN
jgi:hypothetical protein